MKLRFICTCHSVHLASMSAVSSSIFRSLVSHRRRLLTTFWIDFEKQPWPWLWADAGAESVARFPFPALPAPFAFARELEGISSKEEKACASLGFFPSLLLPLPHGLGWRFPCCCSSQAEEE